MLCYKRSSVLFVFKRDLLNRVVLWNGVYNLESIFTMLTAQIDVTLYLNFSVTAAVHLNRVHIIGMILYNNVVMRANGRTISSAPPPSMIRCEIFFSLSVGNTHV